MLYATEAAASVREKDVQVLQQITFPQKDWRSGVCRVTRRQSRSQSVNTRHRWAATQGLLGDNMAIPAAIPGMFS